MIGNKTLQRYEFKYYLSPKISNEIKNDVTKYMDLDKIASFF